MTWPPVQHELKEDPPVFLIDLLSFPGIEAARSRMLATGAWCRRCSQALGPQHDAATVYPSAVDELIQAVAEAVEAELERRGGKR